MQIPGKPLPLPEKKQTSPSLFIHSSPLLLYSSHLSITSVTSVLCSPGLRPLDRNSKPSFGVPLAATFWSVQPRQRLAPRPSHLLVASVSTWWLALPGPPPTRAAGQPELGFSETTVTPGRDVGLQQLGSLLLWEPNCHFPLRHLHPPQPHWTPPSLTAALGTIPAVHWLLPRQPRATPLPIGPALFVPSLRGAQCFGSLGQRSERDGAEPLFNLINPNRKERSRFHLSRDLQAETLILNKAERMFKVATNLKRL